MRLIIRDNYESEVLSDYVLSLGDFGDKAFHPYIAAQKWDLIVIQVSDKTPRGIIRQLLPIACISAYVENWSSISPHQIQILCEIFPDYAGRIKTTYATNKAGIQQLIMSINRRV